MAYARQRPTCHHSHQLPTRKPCTSLYRLIFPLQTQLTRQWNERGRPGITFSITRVLSIEGILNKR